MKKLDVSKYTIKDKKIDKNLKIAFLSDLHNTNIINELVKSIDIEKPDLIIFGGDMINESLDEIDVFLELIKKLGKYPMYYTFGNHEEVFDEDDFNKYYNIISKTKVTNLYNETIDISKNIRLIGFVSELDKYKKFKSNLVSKDYIIDKVGKLDKNKYNILLAHNPLEFNAYVEYNPDLVLSGHVHGGLVILPVLGALLSPNFTFFPKYYKEMYEKNNTKMIVSRGLGHSERIRVRINNNFELIFIELMKE